MYIPHPPSFLRGVGGGGAGAFLFFFRFCVPYSCLSNVSLEVDLRYCKKCTQYDGGWISYFLQCNNQDIVDLRKRFISVYYQHKGAFIIYGRGGGGGQNQ